MLQGSGEKEYTLGFENEPGRRLTGISHSSISYNVNNWLKFKSVGEVEEFLEKWKGHFSTMLPGLKLFEDLKK